MRKDGRSRPPHLRSWRDGWRHLRFLLLYSPRWLFLYPGVALTLLGLVATIALIAGPVTIGAYGLDIGTMMYAMALTIVGYQAVLFAVLSKVYAFHEGFLPASDRFDVFQRRLNLENLIGLGAVIVLAGVLWMVVSLLWWQDAGFGELPPEDSARAVAPAVLGLVLGVQTVMAGLFLSLLRIRVLHPAPDAVEVVRSSRALSRAGAHRRAATSRTARTTRCPRTVIRRRATVAERVSPASRQALSARLRNASSSANRDESAVSFESPSPGACGTPARAR